MGKRYQMLVGATKKWEEVIKKEFWRQYFYIVSTTMLKRTAMWNP